jgi:hypothetical protein
MSAYIERVVLPLLFESAPEFVWKPKHLALNGLDRLRDRFTAHVAALQISADAAVELQRAYFGRFFDELGFEAVPSSTCFANYIRANAVAKRRPPQAEKLMAASLVFASLGSGMSAVMFLQVVAKTMLALQGLDDAAVAFAIASSGNLELEAARPFVAKLGNRNIMMLGFVFNPEELACIHRFCAVLAKIQGGGGN